MHKIKKTLTSFTLATLTFVTACSHTKPFISDCANFEKTDGSSASSTSEVGQVIQRVILIGDAGAPKLCAKENTGEHCEPSLVAMTAWARDRGPKDTFSVFLGDNVYPDGVTAGTHGKCMEINNPKTLKEARKKLEVQAKVLKDSNSNGVFVPGNHDWGGSKGPCHEVLDQQVTTLQDWQKDIPGLQVVDIVPVGCPGPYKIDLQSGVRIIVIDSQWWLTERKPPGCPKPSDRVRQLQGYLSDPATQLNTIVVSHHPPATHGTHGGFYDWKAHIFPLTDVNPYLYLPLPIIGSLYPLSRKYFIKSDQDLVGTENIKMREEWASIYARNAPFIHAAGHDHNLQVLAGKNLNAGGVAGGAPDFVLISGAGSAEKVSRVGDDDDTLFAHSHSGFMVVDFFANTPDLKPDSVLLRIIEPESENGEDAVVYVSWLRGGTFKPIVPEKGNCT